jgi:hypothetical protein
VASTSNQNDGSEVAFVCGAIRRLPRAHPAPPRSTEEMISNTRAGGSRPSSRRLTSTIDRSGHQRLAEAIVNVALPREAEPYRVLLAVFDKAWDQRINHCWKGN